MTVVEAVGLLKSGKAIFFDGNTPYISESPWASESRSAIEISTFYSMLKLGWIQLRGGSVTAFVLSNWYYSTDWKEAIGQLREKFAP